MLPVHIIEDIRRRERLEQEEQPQKYLRLPIRQPLPAPPAEKIETNRGIEVIDLY